MVLGTLDFDHNLVAFAQAPATPYSDMNGYGHFITGWAWFTGYWTLFTLCALLACGRVLGARHARAAGAPAPQSAKLRLAGPPGAGRPGSRADSPSSRLGGWIFYNTNVAQPVPRQRRPRSTCRPATKRPAASTEDLPQPRIIATDNDVHIYPDAPPRAHRRPLPHEEQECRSRSRNCTCIMDPRHRDVAIDLSRARR